MGRRCAAAVRSSPAAPFLKLLSRLSVARCIVIFVARAACPPAALQGGYKAFWKAHGELCEGGYTPMDHPEFTQQLKVGLRVEGQASCTGHAASQTHAFKGARSTARVSYEHVLCATPSAALR